jgi:hypothetical protein
MPKASDAAVAGGDGGGVFVSATAARIVAAI